MKRRSVEAGRYQPGEIQNGNHRNNRIQQMV